MLTWSQRPNFFVFVNFTVPPTDPKIVYQWFDVGVLDYDVEEKLYLVQKVDRDNRVLDTQGRPVVNGGVISNGE